MVASNGVNTRLIELRSFSSPQAQGKDQMAMIQESSQEDEEPLFTHSLCKPLVKGDFVKLLAKFGYKLQH